MNLNKKQSGIDEIFGKIGQFSVALKKTQHAVAERIFRRDNFSIDIFIEELKVVISRKSQVWNPKRLIHVCIFHHFDLTGSGL